MKNRTCVCGGRAGYLPVRIDTAWGDGPTVEVITKGWECSNCHRVVYDVAHALEIQDLAHKLYWEAKQCASRPE